MFFILSLLFLQQLVEPKQTQLSIQIDGIRNDKGHILVALFNNSAGFPDKESLAFSKQRVKATAGTAVLRFYVAEGTYAFAVIHDENDNLKMDKNLVGMPREGFCFSNQAMGTMGPPSFAAASFKATGTLHLTRVKMSYW